MIALCIVIQMGLLVLAKHLLSTWANPVVALIAIWTVILSATAMLGGDYAFSISACLAICGLEIAALAGALVGVVIAPRAPTASLVSLGHARLISWVSLSAGLVSVATIAGSMGYSPARLLNLDVLFEASRTFSVARYEDDYRMPLLARVCQMVVMFGVLVCGFQFARGPRSIRTYEYFLPLLPLVLTAIVLTTRATIIFGLILWSSAYFAGSFGVARRLDWKPFSKRGAVFISFAAAILCVLFVALQFLRGGITDIGRLSEVLDHLKKWPLGGFAGFSVWFEDFRFNEAPTLGFYSLTGVFDLFGIRARDTGIYADYVDLGDGSFGNIYTVFRGLIQDFTVYGAAAIAVAFGVVSSVAVALSMRGRAAGDGALVVLYPIVLFSHVVSFYSYFGHVAAVALFLVYLMYSRRYAHGQR